jgi:hypothetical protein
VDVRAGKLVYAYCIIRNDGSPRSFGSNLGLSKPYLINFEDLSLVVSLVPLKKFDQAAINEKTKDLGWLSQTAKKHERLVEAVMKKTTPIPLKLCTIFRNEHSARSMLKRDYGKLSGTLRTIQGKVELGLSCFASFDTSTLAQESQNPNVKAIQKKIGEASAGRAYFLKQDLDEILVAELATKAYDSANHLHAELKHLADQAKLNKPVFSDSAEKSSGAAENQKILSAAYLVERKQLKKFLMKFEELRKSPGIAPGITVELTGPWPPYNFSQ